MAYKAVIKFVNTLKKWDEMTKENQATDLKSLVFLLGYVIGYDDNKILLEDDKESILKILETRLIYLIENEKIDEIFIIKSLTHYATYLLKHCIEEHGKNIIFFEHMSTKSFIKKHLDKIRSTEYAIAIKNDYYTWKELVELNLNERFFEEYEKDKFIKFSDMLKTRLEAYTRKYGDKTLGEIEQEK